MFIGMTPTEGFQTLLLVLLWNLARPLKRLRFNFKIAFAVSWISNYLTMIPLYFLFYYTGAVAGRRLWRWSSPIGYGEFARLFEPLSYSPFPDSMLVILDISRSLLAPLFLGCLPYAMCCSVMAYHITLIIASQKSVSRPAHVRESGDTETVTSGELP
jgi:uncharacterized protein (DUF2062 family)